MATSTRYDLAAAALNGKIYAMGGNNGAGGKSNNIVEEYTPPRESGIATSDSFTVATLVVDAGEDKIIRHPKNGGTTKIGGTPTASGGMPPYRYRRQPSPSKVVGK
jgi:hypothetical protein